MYRVHTTIDATELGVVNWNKDDGVATKLFILIGFDSLLPYAVGSFPNNLSVCATPQLK